MKKYQIGNLTIEAESPVKALKIAKLFIKDSNIVDGVKDAHTRINVGCAEITVNNEAKAYSVGSVTYPNGRDERTFRDYAKKCIDVANKIKELESKGYREDVMKAYDSMKDDDIEELSDEERKAIEDYKEAIANTKDVKLLKLFAHILKEETEHLEELQSGEIDSAITKDATPITVENIPYKNEMYVVLEFFWNGRKRWIVVAKENYHNEKVYSGGGSVEYSLSEAKKTADDFYAINKLEKKYGRTEGYKKWMTAETDSVIKDANDFVINVGNTFYDLEPLKSVSSKNEAIEEAKKLTKNYKCVEVVYSPEDYSEDKIIWRNK